MKLCVQKDNSQMTPILKNFSLQAGGAHYPEINSEMQEAFAKLILAECIQLAEAEAERFYSMDARDLASAMLNYQELVKQHFGIDHGCKTSN